MVCGMSGNPLLNLLALSLKDIYTDRVSSYVFPEENRDHVRETHAAIAEAMITRDAAIAERLMHDHMAKLAGKPRGPANQLSIHDHANANIIRHRDGNDVHRHRARAHLHPGHGGIRCLGPRHGNHRDIYSGCKPDRRSDLHGDD